VGKIEAVAGVDDSANAELPGGGPPQHPVLGVVGVDDIVTFLPDKGLEAAVGLEILQGRDAPRDGQVVQLQARPAQHACEGGHPAGHVHLVPFFYEAGEQGQHVGRGCKTVQVAYLEDL